MTRAVLVATSVLALAGGAAVAAPSAASAAPSRWCDYVAERGILAANSMVHYWWAVGNASGCWD